MYAALLVPWGKSQSGSCLCCITDAPHAMPHRLHHNQALSQSALSQSINVIISNAVRRHCPNTTAVSAALLMFLTPPASLQSTVIISNAVHRHCPDVVAVSAALRWTVNSLCSGCFAYQEICPYIELSLLRGTSAVRIQ